MLILFEELKSKQSGKAKFRFKPLLAFDATVFNLRQLHNLFSKHLSNSDNKKSIITLKHLLLNSDGKYFSVVNHFLHISNNYKAYPILKEIQKWGSQIVCDLKNENSYRNFAYLINSEEQKKELDYQELQVNYWSLDQSSTPNLSNVSLPCLDSNRGGRENDKNLFLFYFESVLPQHPKVIQPQLVNYADFYTKLSKEERERSIQYTQKLKKKIAKIQNRTVRKRRMKYSTMADWVVRGFERYEYLKVKEEQDFVRENYSGVKLKGFNRTEKRFKIRNRQESWDISNRRRSTNWKECTKCKKQYKD